MKLFVLLDIILAFVSVHSIPLSSSPPVLRDSDDQTPIFVEASSVSYAEPELESSIVWIEASSSKPLLGSKSSVDLYESRRLVHENEDLNLNSFLNEIYLQSTHVRDVAESSKNADELGGLVAQLAESLLSDFNYKTDSTYSASNSISHPLDSAFEIESSPVAVESTPAVTEDFSEVRHSSWVVSSVSHNVQTPKLPQDVEHQLTKSSSILSPEQSAETKSKSSFPNLVTAFRPSALRLTPTPQLAHPLLVSSLVYKNGDPYLELLNLIPSINSLNILSSPIVKQSALKEQQSLVEYGANDPLSSSFVHHFHKTPLDRLKTSVVPSRYLMTSDIVQMVTSVHPSAEILAEMPEMVEVNDISLVRPNTSDAEVDKIIEGLMNIIRPLKNDTSSTVTPVTLPSPPPLVTPELHGQQVEHTVNIHEHGNVVPNLSSVRVRPVVSLKLKPSPTVSSSTKPSSDDLSSTTIEVVLQNNRIEPSTSSVKDATVFSIKPFTSELHTPTVLFHNHLGTTVFVSPSNDKFLETASAATVVESATMPVKRRPILKRPTLVRTTTTKTPEVSSKKPTTAAGSISKQPVFDSYGVAEVILLDSESTTESLPTRIDSRLPPLFNTGSGFLDFTHESVIGSSVLQLNGNSTILKPNNKIKPSLVFATAFIDKDATPTLLEPSLTSSSNRPSVIPVPIRIISSSRLDVKPTQPLPEVVVDTTEPFLMDHFSSSESKVVSTHSAIVIKPTASSSSQVRQTIFQTVVSISSDDFHTDEEEGFHEENHEVPSDVFHGGSHDDSESSFAAEVGVVPPSKQAVRDETRETTTSTTTSTTTASSTSTTTTTVPSTIKAMLVTSSATTTTTSTRPTTTIRTTKTPITTRMTRRPLRRRTTKRPVNKNKKPQESNSGKPQSDDAVTTSKPTTLSRPTHSLMSFGFSLLPAAVIATVIGIPLALATGKKKRDVDNIGSGNLSSEEWLEIEARIEELVRRNFKP